MLVICTLFEVANVLRLSSLCSIEGPPDVVLRAINLRFERLFAPEVSLLFSIICVR